MRAPFGGRKRSRGTAERLRFAAAKAGACALALTLGAAGPVVADTNPYDVCGSSTAHTPTRLVKIEGTFGESVEGDYVLVPFTVPAGTTALRVRLCRDRAATYRPELAGRGAPQVDHTLDLGLYEPTADGFPDGNEFRGWGGSSRMNVLISPEAKESPGASTSKTTPGFRPGRIPAGIWYAEIGVAQVVGAAEGEPDGAVAWRLDVWHRSKHPGDSDNPWAPAPYRSDPANSRPGWYKGDFHVHAEHSNGARMDTTFDYAFKTALLDFVTLSDYVTDRHWDEIGRFQADYPGKLIIRSAEVITYRGHVNNHASARWVDYRTGAVLTFDPATRRFDVLRRRGERKPSHIFDEIHAAGGWTQINHPTTFPATVPGFGNICRGCSWEYSASETDWSKVDAMEVQTGPAGTHEPSGNEIGPNPFTPLAIERWDRLRREGFDITAVGSSDSHDAGRQSLTQSPIGEATTVVYAPELSEAGIRTGILEGHAYVKFFGPDGPDLRLEARVPGRPGERIMGDTLAAASAEFRAEVLGEPLDLRHPAQPRVLVVLRDGVPIDVRPVVALPFVHTFAASRPGDYRVQLHRSSALEALTNPITLVPPRR